MIKIIKHGQTEFNCTCSRCGCEFTYEHEDITLTSFVVCPDCGEHCYIGGNKHGQPKIGWPTPGEPVPCNIPLAPVNADPCTDCDWWKKMTQPGGAIYVGDTPCTWCNKNKFYCGTDTALTYTGTPTNSIRGIISCADDINTYINKKCNSKEHRAK